MKQESTIIKQQMYQLPRKKIIKDQKTKKKNQKTYFNKQHPNVLENTCTAKLSVIIVKQ